MASFADAAEDLIIQGREGINSKINGRYKLQPKPCNGAKCFFNAKSNCYLYKLDDGDWHIASKLGSAGCFAIKSLTDPVEDSPWNIYCGKENGWQSDPAVSLIRASEFDATPVAEAVAVDCRFGNIAGGYKKSGDDEGRGVYHNVEDGKFIYYMPTHGRWFIGDEVGSASFYNQSCATACRSPEEAASWEGCSVRAVELGGGGGGGGAGGGTFEDPDFGAAESSLVGKEPPPADVCWIRATCLQPDGEAPRLFNGVEPNDVMQGSLGDCWLLAAIAAVAEFPQFIEEQMFTTRELNPEGRYTLKLYDIKKGDWEEVVVDDLIPCHEKKWWEPASKPLYAQPKDNELYILLIEKAFAKFAGSYGALSGGFPAVAWMAMTGCEEQHYWRRKEGTWEQSMMALDYRREHPRDFQSFYTTKGEGSLDDGGFFEFLNECDDKNYIMGASIAGDTIEKQRTDGLVERHAYSLIQVNRVPASEYGDEVLICEMRNPWGNAHEWNGTWSDGDAASWTARPDVAESCKFKGGSADGLFWISFADFIARYTTVQVSAKSMPVRRASFGLKRHAKSFHG